MALFSFPQRLIPTSPPGRARNNSDHSTHSGIPVPLVLGTNSQRNESPFCRDVQKRTEEYLHATSKATQKESALSRRQFMTRCPVELQNVRTTAGRRNDAAEGCQYLLTLSKGKERVPLGSATGKMPFPHLRWARVSSGVREREFLSTH